ncbi:phospholipase D family protein [Azorhizobium doebereinerae]|uniref:phospholipase D family protein n=1 Tax=Azorhizobium doebereinerae TaxID=281091 RepID=UPI0012EBDD9D|nr:phospholipase D family protein [Azorhizobium doebereinerae]
MAFLQGDRLTQVIRMVVKSSRCDLAVAYWGSTAITELDLPTDLNGYQIACDADSGLVSPDVVRTLLKREAAVYAVPKLHSKVYRADTQMVVTSANASTNGLAGDAEVDMGLEAGVLITDQGEIKSAEVWLTSIFGKGRPLAESDLPWIRKLWNRRRSQRLTRLPLAEAILAQSPDIKDRNIKVHIYGAAEPPPEVMATYKGTDFYDADKWDEEVYPFYWGRWPSVKVRDQLLTFEWSGRKASCDGVWELVACIKSGPEPVWPAVKIDRPMGLALGGTRVLDRRVTDAVKGGKLTPDGVPLSLERFASIIAEVDAP